MRKKNGQMIAKITAVSLCFFVGFASIGTDIPVTYASEEAQTGAETLLTSEDGESIYTLLEDGTASLVYYSGLPQEGTDANGNQIFTLKLPDTIDGKAVSEIQSCLFQNSDQDTLNRQMMTNIVELPAGLERVETDAFDDILYLGEYRISEENPNFCVENGILFDKDKTVLVRVPQVASPADGAEDYVIPESVEKIGDKAFYNCIGIQKITISQNVKSIGENAFYRYLGMEYDFSFFVVPENEYFTIEDRSLFSSDKTILYRFVAPEDESGFGINLYDYTIPDTVKKIGSSAFQGCSAGFAGLTSIIIPDGVEEIGKSAFENCTLLGMNDMEDSDGVVIPDSVVKIDDSAFKDCASVKKFKLSANLKMIGDDAFGGCQELTEITLPESLEKIGNDAFYGTTMVSVAIPAEVTEIGDRAFGYTFNSETYNVEKYDDFEVGYTAGTAAEKWVTDNGFKAGEVIIPSNKPSSEPSNVPSEQPSDNPVTQAPDTNPTGVPSTEPTVMPSAAPSQQPGAAASNEPSVAPSQKPGAAASNTPEVEPTRQPDASKTQTKKTQKPKAPKLISVKNTAKNKMVIKWKKVSDIAGYQICYAANKKFTKPVKINVGKKVVRKDIKKLKKKTYFVKVRAYVKTGNKKVYSGWSSTKKTTIKK